MALSQLVSLITVLRCNRYELLTNTRISEYALMMHSVVHLIIRGLDGLGHVAGCRGALSLLA